MLSIASVQEKYAASYRECLDAVARERRYLAQTEALPLANVSSFMQRGDTVDVMAEAHRRKSGGIAARLAKLGLIETRSSTEYLPP